MIAAIIEDTLNSLNWLWRALAWPAAGLVCLLLGLFVGFELWTPAVVREFQAALANSPNNTLIYAEGDVLVSTVQGSEDRHWVPLAEISAHLQKAAVAIEDRRFFAHKGLDPVRLAGAVWADLRSMSYEQGGSTITQQLVKLSLLSPERTLQRKVRESFMAIALEREVPKRDILEAYLNRVYFGNGLYGVEKASEAYFNKSAADLTLNEAALLAALVKKPEGYLLGADADAASPYLPLAKLQPLMRRQRQVIETLRKIGWISEEEFQASATQPLRARRPRADAGAAPYYVQQVMKELKELLAGSRISGRGYRVYTALDPRQQAKAEELAARIAKEHREASQAALVAIEPQTGFVRALVGGVNYRLSQFNRATQALRQPGSAFKPILYATALEQGFTPRSVFLDEPVRFAWAGAGKTFERRQVQGMLASAVAGEPFDDPGALAGGGPPEAEGQYYEPHNFGDRYGLPSLIPETAQMAEDRHMTLGRALELSSNVIAVQLLDQVGLRRVAAQAQRWNIPLRPEAGLCAALGCSETTLLSLTAAYAAFANGGLTVRPVFIKRVTNNNGDVLFENSPDFPNPVISPWTAFEMRKLLQGVIERGTGARARIGREAGGKTGTNDGPRDTWFIGFTPSLVAGVWIGNDDNRPMPSEQGGRTTARMWAEFMRAAPVPGGGEQFPEPPDKYAGLRICNLDGQVSQPNCPDTGTYYFRESELSPEVFAGALAETAPAPREEPLAPENSAPSPAPRSPDVTFPPAPRSAPPD